MRAYLQAQTNHIWIEFCQDRADCLEIEIHLQVGHIKAGMTAFGHNLREAGALQLELCANLAFTLGMRDVF